MKDADRRKLHPVSHRYGGFPLFFSDNALLYDQMNAETIIESSICRFLVNGIFKEFFSREYCNTHQLSCQWTAIHNGHLINSIDNLENNLPYPIEFVIEAKGVRTGYRYTNIYAKEDKISNIFQNKKLDYLIIIDFSSPTLSTFVHKDTILSEKYRDKVRVMFLKEFITKFFSYETYVVYIEEVQKVIHQAYNYVGLQTIQKLNLQYLPHFIDVLKKRILSSSVESKQFQIINRSLLQGKTLQDLRKFKGSITTTDAKILYQNFYSRSRFLSLCGSKDFAHSFITSEYLYMAMKDNNRFDYTAIVCGYLKSIEQIIYLIMQASLNNHDISGIYIKRNNAVWRENIKEPKYEYPENRKARHIPFEKKYEKYFDTTFQPLVNLLKDYKNGWELSPNAVNLIATYLSIFCIECRNEHFHKDNISNIDEVEIIRDNAWLLLFWIIGGIKLTSVQEKDYLILGIQNNVFDKMYWAIMHISSGGDYFLIKFPSQNPILVAMPMNQEEKGIDENGCLRNTRLRFIKLNRDTLGDWQNDDWSLIDTEFSDSLAIYIDKDNMPDEVFYVDKLTGKASQIMW